ncbi:transposable element Tcb2 transposase [Trichonephila clavipes]|nr:transposable element Tcb2 transposase [Trichonephila clavipes]
MWCREHRNWRDNEWGRVLFTDESRFSLSSDSHRILIWRERGSRNHPSNIIESDRYGGRGVLVWGGIMLGSRTDLHIFDAGSVNGTRYCNEILLPYVRLFRGAMGLDDNAPCHRTVAAEQLLESEDIERMDWPARSPDLNPIEHVWDFLGRCLAARILPPVTIRELRLALQDEWAAMPQQLIDTLILSMGRRCETCLAIRGDHIPTKDRMFLAGHPSQGCFGLQSHCAPCYFFNKASFYPSDFSFMVKASGRDWRVKSSSPVPLKTRHLAKLEKEIELQTAKNKALSLNPAAKVEEKQFETLNKETATHIGIREAEDWFRPIALAKECDIYISSRSGSHKEIPITYGYTQDPFKNRSQNFKPKIKENYPQYLEREKKMLYMR